MINWEDVRLFIAVARARGLVRAVQTTGLSAPTLGRRILALERELGVTLFDRHRLGYDLTPAGQEFLDRSQGLEQGAISLERWRMEADPSPVVKIAAGFWTSQYIAGSILSLLSEDQRIKIELVSGVDPMDLSRREVNLGIRNKRPTQIGLAGRKIGQVDFAIYGCQEYIQNHPTATTAARFEQCDWVSLSSLQGSMPSLSWLDLQLVNPVRLACSTPQAVMEAVLENAGLCVLPCFIGDRKTGLVRVSDPIEALQSTRWLVTHDDDRFNKPIRHVADRLINLFLEERIERHPG